MYGRYPSLPHEILESSPVTHFGTVDDYWAELLVKLRRSHEMAKEAMTEASETRRIQHKKTIGGSRTHVEDEVFLKVEYLGKGLSEKLAPKWKSPYVLVLEVLSPAVYKLNAETVSRATVTCHAHRLKMAKLARDSATVFGRCV